MTNVENVISTAGSFVIIKLNLGLMNGEFRDGHTLVNNYGSLILLWKIANGEFCVSENGFTISDDGKQILMEI